MLQKNVIFYYGIMKGTRRRIFKRKKDEPALTAAGFAKYMNALFIKYDVFKNPDATEHERIHMTWSESTALRHMHEIKLKYGCYARGYCDGHEREDVVAARQDYIRDWYALEPRMHLWCKRSGSWHHVDEYKLTGEHALDRDLLGDFGGMCKIGTQWANDPADLPLLVFANDESTYRYTTHSLIKPSHALMLNLTLTGRNAQTLNIGRAKRRTSFGVSP